MGLARGLDPTWPWPLAWEPPYATSVTLKRQKENAFGVEEVILSSYFHKMNVNVEEKEVLIFL